MIKISEITKPMLDEFKDESGAIYVGAVVTHSGFVNSNQFFYLPIAMENSVETFTEPFQKPLLKQHFIDGTPLGRVVDGFYFAMNDSNTLLNIHDEFRAAADSYERQVGLSIKYAELLGPDEIRDFRNGLGGIYLVFKVPGKADIDKIVDGRYLTLSVAGDTTAATCSICRQNWSKEGYCEHEPGKIYDGKLAFLIAGMEFEWEEISAVNTPADKGAQIMHIFRPNELANSNLKEIVMPKTKEDIKKGVADSAQPKGEETIKVKDEVKIEDQTKEQVTEALTAANEELENLKQKIKDLENEKEELATKVNDLTTDLTSANELNTSLSDELRDVLLVKLSDAFGAIGRNVPSETLKEKYGEKSIDQLRDLIEVLNEGVTSLSDEETDNKGGDETKEDPKVDPEDKVEDEPKPEDKDDTEIEDKDQGKDGKTKIEDLKQVDQNTPGDTVVEDDNKTKDINSRITDRQWRRFMQIKARQGEAAARSYLEQLTKNMANKGK